MQRSACLRAEGRRSACAQSAHNAHGRMHARWRIPEPSATFTSGCPELKQHGQARKPQRISQAWAGPVQRAVRGSARTHRPRRQRARARMQARASTATRCNNRRRRRRRHRRAAAVTGAPAPREAGARVCLCVCAWPCLACASDALQLQLTAPPKWLYDLPWALACVKSRYSIAVQAHVPHHFPKQHIPEQCLCICRHDTN
mgnify:CR=1 FL=1